MAPRRASQVDLRRMSDRLHVLRLDPPQQRAYAAELLAGGEIGELLPRVIAALGPPFEPAIRPALLARYAALDRNGPRNDPGGTNRALLLQALTAISTGEDLALFVSAAEREERSMQEPNGPSALRAAGLLGLERLDPATAIFQALRMLADPARTLEMTGEPALTAVKVLANLGQDHVLYYHALSAGRLANPEALGEAIRSLVNLPEDEIDRAITQFGANPDDVVAAGACDLALASASPVAAGHIRAVLESDRIELVGYVVFAIAALRRPAWLELLYERAATETVADRQELVIEALKAVAGDPKAKAALDLAEYRLGALRNDRPAGNSGARGRPSGGA